MVDRSFTITNMTCMWYLLKFWGRELVCPYFTNVKGFFLSIAGFVITSYALQSAFMSEHYYCSYIRSLVIVPMWFFSIASCALETLAMIARYIYHCDHFFSARSKHIPSPPSLSDDIPIHPHDM